MTLRRDVLTGKTAIISGSSSGIGASLARKMIGAGCTVYGAARRYEEDWPEKPESRDDPKQGAFWPVRLDVTDARAVAETVSRVLDREGKIDYLILSAGAGIAGAVEECPVSDVRDQLEVNLIGQSAFLPPVLTAMRQRNSGLVVFIGSAAGFLPIPFQAWYSASKAAIQALSLALDDEIRPFGLRSLVVHPGDTQTGFTGARRVTNAADTESSPYAGRFRRSLSRMERDESEGMSADQVAGLILRQITRRRIPRLFIPGRFYQLAWHLSRWLPLNLVRRVIRGLYAG